MMRRLLRDPLAHFLVAGAAIWAALSFAGEPVDPTERTIALTKEEQANLALGFERTMGRPPTDAELDAQIESWVREEVLYREALRLGLDAGDPVVRRRLSTKMDDLAGAEVETARPSDETLAAWLRDHPGRFAQGERFTFSQKYFRSDDALQKALDGTGDANGDTISLPERMADASYADIKAVFGSQFAAQIARMQEASGAQVTSGYGYHLVDVEERVEGRQRPLSEIRDRVEADWRSSTAAARRARAFDLLRTIPDRDRMIRWLLALAVLFIASPASADELRPVSIQLEQVDEERWNLGWRQPLASPQADRTARPHLPEICEFATEPVLDNSALAVVGRAQVYCEGDIAGSRIGWPALFGQGDAILRVAPLGRSVQVYRLTAQEPFAKVEARPSSTQVWRGYFVIGVEHILAGWDHLLFVIALVLLVGRTWPVVKAATAFTVAHSITLAATTLGVTGLPQRPVEALIALSIVFLAVEIARGTKDTITRRLPWLVAFAFGLLHGFGFAGALREIGLPEGEVPAALVRFNLGVEAGQLLVIAAVLAALAVIRRVRAGAEAPALHVASYAIGITGAYWLVDRVIG